MFHNHQPPLQPPKPRGSGNPMDKTQDNIQPQTDSPIKDSTNTVTEFAGGYLEQMYTEGIEQDLEKELEPNSN